MSAFESFPRITPFLWFASNAEEAVDFYLTVFKNSRKIEAVNNNPGHPNPPAKVLTISFELDGQKFIALNGGPMFQFTEAISFVVRCDTQQEVDDYWSKLTAEAAPRVNAAGSKTSSASPGRSFPHECPTSSSSPKALEAMMKMKKLDIAELERAAKS